MAKLKTNVDFITTGHFPAYVLVSYGKTYEEIKAWLLKNGSPLWVDGLDHYKSWYKDVTFWAGQYNDTEGRPFFYTHFAKKLNLADRDYDVLGHEAFHLVQFVSDTFKADLVEEKESSAYLHTHFVRSISQVIKEAK